MKEDKNSIESALAEINKLFGGGTIGRLSDKPQTGIDAISTRIPSLDSAIGIGGIPRGRIIELYGANASGKTSCALQIIAEAQAQGGLCALLDLECALDPGYAEKLGVNINDLLVSQPSSGDEAMEIAEALIQSGKIAIIVVDSVAAMVPQAELNASFGDSCMGLHARLMSQTCRKLTGLVAQSNTCLLFINQTRSNIGGYGSPVTTSGGKALGFYSSLRLEISRVAHLKNGEEIIGGRTRFKIVKNKVGPPFKQVEVDLIYGEGFSLEGDIIDQAIAKKVLTQSGSWIKMGDESIAQGKEKLRARLKGDADLSAKLLSLINGEEEAEVA